ncbi:hypothetical protein ACFPRL_08575 [Pseudoclavibacter helvolus]
MSVAPWRSPVAFHSVSPWRMRPMRIVLHSRFQAVAAEDSAAG